MGIREGKGAWPVLRSRRMPRFEGDCLTAVLMSGLCFLFVARGLRGSRLFLSGTGGLKRCNKWN